MITSLILQLRSPENVVLPATLGQAGQSLLYRLIQSHDSDLATRIHDTAGLKPLTASGLLMGKLQGRDVHIQAEEDGWIRFTGLNQEVSKCLLNIVKNPPHKVELDHVQFIVTHATINPDEHIWAGTTTYQDLSRKFLLSTAKHPRHIALKFFSPTTFRRKGKFLPLPLPDLVFGSLLDRWQLFAHIALHPDVRRFADEMVMVKNFNIRSRAKPYKQRAFIGFTGEVSFQVMNQDHYWISVLSMLAEFSFYSGIGYRTSVGFGQVKKLGNV